MTHHWKLTTWNVVHSELRRKFDSLSYSKDLANILYLDALLDAINIQVISKGHGPITLPKAPCSSSAPIDIPKSCASENTDSSSQSSPGSQGSPGSCSPEEFRKISLLYRTSRRRRAFGVLQTTESNLPHPLSHQLLQDDDSDLSPPEEGPSPCFFPGALFIPSSDTVPSPAPAPSPSSSSSSSSSFSTSSMPNARGMVRSRTTRFY